MHNIRRGRERKNNRHKNKNKTDDKNSVLCSCKWYTADPSRKLRRKSGGNDGDGGSCDDDDTNKFFFASSGHGLGFGCHAHWKTKTIIM